MDSLGWWSLFQPKETFRTLPFPAGKIQLCFSSYPCPLAKRGTWIFCLCWPSSWDWDVLATAGRKRVPQITHLVLHLLSLLLFQAETHGQVSLQAEISALHQMDCTWRGAPELLPKQTWCLYWKQRTWECGKDLVCHMLIWRPQCGCPGADGWREAPTPLCWSWAAQLVRHIPKRPESRLCQSHTFHFLLSPLVNYVLRSHLGGPVVIISCWSEGQSQQISHVLEVELEVREILPSGKGSPGL